VPCVGGGKKHSNGEEPAVVHYSYDGIFVMDNATILPIP
jgi:hypothetical protein